MKEMVWPNILRDLETGVGFFNYYRKYVPHYSQVVEPLNRLRAIGFKTAPPKGKARLIFASKTNPIDNIQLNQMNPVKKQTLIKAAKAAWKEVK